MRSAVGEGKLERVELGRTTRPPHLSDDRKHAVLRHHAVDLGLGARAVPDQGEPVADELAQLSCLGRGDPTLGEATEAEHRGEVLRVTLVVFHAAVAPVVAEGVG